MSIAIEKLADILKTEPSIPKAGVENRNFVPEYISTRFREYLSPDSDNYRCVINPVFSLEFELSTEHFLKQVQVFSLRDGVLPLLRFFAVNPEPDEKFPLLVIDCRLSALVPVQWREKIILRKGFYEGEIKKTKNVLFCFSSDPYNLPLDVLEEELLRLKEETVDAEEILLYFSSMKMRGGGEARFDSAWGYKTLAMFTRVFSEKKFRILSYNELMRGDVSELKFHLVNPLCYYYTDSFLEHDLLQRGATPFIVHKLVSNMRLNLSLNHGYVFHQNFQPYLGEEHDKVMKKIFCPVGTYSPGEPFRAIRARLYPEDFMDWAYDVGRSLWGNCHKRL